MNRRRKGAEIAIWQLPDMKEPRLHAKAHMSGRFIVIVSLTIGLIVACDNYFFGDHWLYVKWGLGKSGDLQE